ncbi:hypothetical protein MHU86_8516 [Fragilaria crotonensis]|nr:hypothetical protein MHU86_8516 [Fragilaria crotonensis]
MDTTNNKMGKTTDKNGPTNYTYASTNVKDNNIETNDAFTTEEDTITAAKRRNHPNRHNKIDLTNNTNDLKTPQKAPNLPPTLTYKSRANTPNISTAKVTTLTNFAQLAHLPISQTPVCMNPSEFTTLQKTCKDLHDSIFAHLFNLPFHPSSTQLECSSDSKQQQCQEESKAPPTFIHCSHHALEEQIIQFTLRIVSFGYAPTVSEFLDYLQYQDDLENLVNVAIKITEDDQLKTIIDLLTIMV